MSSYLQGGMVSSYLQGVCSGFALCEMKQPLRPGRI